MEDAGWHAYRALMGARAVLPAYFVQAVDVSAEDQLRVMAAAQGCVDNAISKTVRLPHSATPQEHGVVLHRAWRLGLKGCAVYREGSREGVVNGYGAVERRQHDASMPLAQAPDLFDK